MRSALIHNDLTAQLPSIDRAEGVWLWDTSGKRYFDACSGAVVTNIGHAHPRVVAAIAAQAARVTFTHRGAFTSKDLDSLADRLASLTGYAGVWFVNSGSEAVEACMQFALQYFQELGHPERSQFLSHRRGYHGNTLGGLSLSGHARRLVVSDIAHDYAVLEAPGEDVSTRTLSDSENSRRLLDGVRKELEQREGTVAGIVVEPVGGATLGCTVPPDGYLTGLRSLCDEFGVLLVADEVMTGMGRTGTMLAVDHWGVRPDLIAIGKGLGAGYAPIAAALVNERILTALKSGSGRVLGGHTYAGNPLVASTALAVLDVLDQEHVIDNAIHISPILEDLMRTRMSEHDCISDVRGLGMMFAFEFVAPAGSTTGATSKEFARICQNNGAIVYPATGGFNDAVSIAPPLTVTPAELAELFAVIDRSLSELEGWIRALSAA